MKKPAGDTPTFYFLPTIFFCALGKVKSMKMEKNAVVALSTNDKRYEVISKEQIGDVVKIDFRYEEIIYFGIITKITSSGLYTIKVKGIYGIDNEDDLE